MDTRLEERYIVIKYNQLTVGQHMSLANLIDTKLIPTIDCLVVEADWPAYPTCVELVLGQPCKS